jgi:DNA-binding transcriptional ArsR family regulator
MSSPDLDAIFAALADPTRRAIVARLARGEANVLELAEPFAISLPAISRHLKVLEHAGLITRGRDAQRRPCELRTDALDLIAAWTRHTKQVWEDRFKQLDSYLKKLQSEKNEPPKPHPPEPSEKRAKREKKKEERKSHGRKK